jgi:hypothetical protein
MYRQRYIDRYTDRDIYIYIQRESDTDRHRYIDRYTERERSLPFSVRTWSKAANLFLPTKGSKISRETFDQIKPNLWLNREEKKLFFLNFKIQYSTYILLHMHCTNKYIYFIGNKTLISTCIDTSDNFLIKKITQKIFLKKLHLYFYLWQIFDKICICNFVPKIGKNGKK